MIKTFTKTDILRYIYNETNAEETQLIKHTLEIDKKLRSFYLKTQKLKSDLNHSLISPSDSFEEKILEYSKNFS